MSRVRELRDDYTINRLLYDALSPIGLPCSEEPTGSTDDTRAYIIWRQNDDKKFFASGKMYAETLYFTVLLQAAKTGEHLETTQAMVAQLLDAGCVYARASQEIWNAELNRRECPISCALRVRRA